MMVEISQEEYKSLVKAQIMLELAKEAYRLADATYEYKYGLRPILGDEEK